MQQRDVNPRQLEVLRWIADGCPSDVMEDFSYKTTAVALMNRGLAVVSKRGGWHASITESGRYYLAHGAYLEPSPGPPQPKRPHTHVLTSAAAETKPVVRKDSQSSPHKPFPDEAEPAEAAVKPTEPPMPAKPVRNVAVPQRLLKPHPVIAEARDGGALPVSKSLVPRLVRVAHALAVAFEHEGWTVRSKSKSVDRWGRPWNGRELFVVDTGEYRQGVYIGEENDRTDHVLTASELKQKERYSYSYAPKYDYTPSGRLFIEIETWHRGRRQRWADRQRWTLEEKLGQIVDEIEARTILEREDRVERERKEVEQQTRIQAAVQEAGLLLRESRRKDVFLAQVEQWHSANRIREYLAAMETAITGLPDGDSRLEALDWMRWCRSCAAALDPLESAIHFPEDPEPSEEALRPFLPDWMRRGW